MENKVFNFSLALLVCVIFVASVPIITDNDETTTPYFNLSDVNGSAKDLYVIKTIVYEVGILTNATNDTSSESNETNEQVDLTFYNAHKNGSLLDLSHIPMPIQTNVSGQVITGVAPVSLGALDLGNGTSHSPPTFIPPAASEIAPLLPENLTSVVANISTTNATAGSQLLSNLPPVLGLNQTAPGILGLNETTV